MKRYLALGAALILLPAVVEAITISGSATGTWNTVVHDSDDVWSLNNADNNTGPEASTFNWGDNTELPSTDNQFAFNGINSFTALSGNAFLLGTFSYLNGTVWDYSSDGILGVNLAVDFSLTAPISNASAGSAAFRFSIFNTPNEIGETDEENGDIVKLEDMTSAFSFTYNNRLYSFELLGFSLNLGQDIITEFSSPENGTAIAGLYGRFNETPVPEPATLILMGLGVTAFAAVRRRSGQTKE